MNSRNYVSNMSVNFIFCFAKNQSGDVKHVSHNAQKWMSCKVVVSHIFIAPNDWGEWFPIWHISHIYEILWAAQPPTRLENGYVLAMGLNLMDSQLKVVVWAASWLRKMGSQAAAVGLGPGGVRLGPGVTTGLVGLGWQRWFCLVFWLGWVWGWLAGWWFGSWILFGSLDLLGSINQGDPWI